MKFKINIFIIVFALGTLLASGNALAKDMFYYIGNGLIQVIDGDSDAIVGDIPVEGWLRETEFSADQKYLYAVANRHLIHKIDLARQRVVDTIDVGGGGWERFIFGFDLAPDGNTAYVNLLSRKAIQGEALVTAPQLAQIDLADGHILRSIEVPWSSVALVSVEDSNEIYVIGKDIVKVDTSAADMRVKDTYPMFSKQWNVLPLWDNSHENDGLFMLNYYTPQLMGLLSIDTKSGKITDTPLNGPPVFAYSVMRSPDQKKVYAVMDELTVIDLASRSYDSINPIPSGTVYALGVSSDGSKVYTTGGGSITTVFDSHSLKPIKTLKMQVDGMDLRRLTF